MIRPLPTIAALALLLSACPRSWAAAAEPSADPTTIPVALIDGKPITLRQVEDALLKKEGSEQLEEWVHAHLEHIDWSKLSDDEVILAIGGTQLKRKELAVSLLKSGTGKVREDLINITLVENALVKQGVTIDQQAIDSAFASMERKFKSTQKDKSQQIDFASYIQAKEGLPPDEFKKQAGFRMFAGVRALVVKRAREELSDADRMLWFDGHRARYDQREGVELSDIFLPYYPRKDKDGKDVVDEDERNRLMSLVLGLFVNIRDGKQEFALTWSAFSKGRDPDTAEGGKLGWVGHDGTRANPAARVIPKQVVDLAFAVTKFPTLLQPELGPNGIDLVRVDAHREAKLATYDEVKERVFQDLLEEQLDDRTQRMMGDLRRAADIQMKSIPDAIEQRSR